MRLFTNKMRVILIVIVLFQSKLNCEVLSQDVGLQVRWSVVSDSIILQVVGDLGKYL